MDLICETGISACYVYGSADLISTLFDVHTIFAIWLTFLHSFTITFTRSRLGFTEKGCGVTRLGWVTGKKDGYGWGVLGDFHTLILSSMTFTLFDSFLEERLVASRQLEDAGGAGVT